MLSFLLSPKGRIRRRDYAVVFSAVVLILGLAAGIDIYALSDDPSSPSMMVLGATALLIIWPWIAACVKRWHDTGRTGWWTVLCFLPVVAPFAYVGLLGLPGTKGENRFGPDPRQQNVEDTGMMDVQNAA